MEKEINVIILGDKGIGNTSIFNRIKHGAFDEAKDNSNINDIEYFNLKRKYEKKDITISLNIKDIKNQDKYNGNIPKQYIRDNHIVILVLSNKEWLNNIKSRWYDYYKENANIENSRFILIWYKSDEFGDQRYEIIKKGNILAEEIDAHFIKCSEKNNDNFDNVERYIIIEARRFIDEVEKNLNENNNINIKIEEEMEEKVENISRKSNCCKC